MQQLHQWFGGRAEVHSRDKLKEKGNVERSDLNCESMYLLRRRNSSKVKDKHNRGVKTMNRDDDSGSSHVGKKVLPVCEPSSSNINGVKEELGKGKGLWRMKKLFKCGSDNTKESGLRNKSATGGLEGFSDIVESPKISLRLERDQVDGLRGKWITTDSQYVMLEL